VYSVESGKSVQVTDGMSDAMYPVFDRNGKYLYFAASTDIGLTAGWLDMSSYQHPVTRSVYAAVLRKDLPSPVPPQSDDEEVKGKDEEPGKKDAKKGKASDGKAEKESEGPSPVDIDFEGIGQRIVALPTEPGNYVGLTPGKDGVLYLTEAPVVDVAYGPPALTISRFDLEKRKTKAILDERYNHGGSLADYIIDYLNRPPMSRVSSREGADYTEPVSAIFGPKVMIINQFAGSGGDAMPWYFRKAKIGPLVGVRTWGGLVGISGYPVLMDGGRITAPRWAIYGLDGKWEVENHGIAPDVEVEQDPALVRDGHDPQLEAAVKTVMDLLAKNPPRTFERPPYPVYHHPLPKWPEGGR